MARRYLVPSFLLVTLSLLGITLAVWTSTDPHPSKSTQNVKSPARMLDPVLNIVSTDSIELEIEGYPNIVAIATDDHGNMYLLLHGPSAPEGTEYSIQKFAPDGKLLGNVPLSPEIWEPRVLAYDLGVGKDGNLYVAVEWPVKRGGIIAVSSNGILRSKLTFSDFVPHKITVDSQDQVWVVGQEVDPVKVALATHHIPVDPKKPYEQLRIYTGDLRLLDIPVRDQKVGFLPSTLSTTGDEVVYYASGTNTIRVFRQGQLTRSLAVPELTPIAPPAEVSAGDFNSLRAVKGVYKIGDRFLIAGFYNYTPAPDSGGKPTLFERKFIALMSMNGDAASLEFEPPSNLLPWAYSGGYLISISGGFDRLLKVTKIKLEI